MADETQTGQSRKEQARRVVGLAYEPEHGVPRVTLKAVGATAEDVIWRSQRGATAPLVRDPKLLESLYRLPVDSDIPPDLFELVAIVLVHIAAADARMQNNKADIRWDDR